MPHLRIGRMIDPSGFEGVDGRLGVDDGESDCSLDLFGLAAVL